MTTVKRRVAIRRLSDLPGVARLVGVASHIWGRSDWEAVSERFGYPAGCCIPVAKAKKIAACAAMRWRGWGPGLARGCWNKGCGFLVAPGFGRREGRLIRRGWWRVKVAEGAALLRAALAAIYCDRYDTEAVGCGRAPHLTLAALASSFWSFAKFTRHLVGASPIGWIIPPCQSASKR